MEHAKLTHEFDLQEKAVFDVTSQLKEIKDLEIEKQYEGWSEDLQMTAERQIKNLR